MSSVLQCLVDPLHAAGFHIILYNSRGVGRSSGWPTLNAKGETEDLEAMVDWGMNRNSLQVETLLLIVSGQYNPDFDVIILHAGIQLRFPAHIIATTVGEDLARLAVLPAVLPRHPHHVQFELALGCCRFAGGRRVVERVDRVWGQR